MQNYYTTNRTKNIDIIDRIIISKSLSDGDSIKTIANDLGYSRQSISKEIKRGTIEMQKYDYTFEKVYDPYAAQYDHENAARWKGRISKIDDNPDLKAFVEKCIKQKYSPEVIAHLIDLRYNNGQVKNKICFKTIYNWIDQNRLSVTRKNLLYAKNKRKKPHNSPKIHEKPIGGESIELRPDIDNREEFGHWEIDCVVGQREGKSTCLMTLVERKTRYGIIIRIPRKNKKSIVNALKSLKRKYGKHFYDIFKTITADNGSEFKDAEGMSLSLKNGKKVRIFFAHAYSSWERGSNENFNRMIRRYFPKGTNFTDITIDKITRVNNLINNYPRRQFNFNTAKNIFDNELTLLYN